MIKKIIALVLVIVMVSAVAACSTSNKVNQDNTTAQVNTTAAETQQKVDDFSPFGRYSETVVMTQGKAGTRDKNLPEGDTLGDNKYYDYVEDRINVRVKNAWELDGDAYFQKIAVSIASSDIPDVMMINDKLTLTQLVDAGLVADLTEALDKAASPYIKDCYDSYNGKIFPAATYDGKIMAMPYPMYGGEHNQLWIRQDWLEKLGLPEPKTLDDIITIAKAFIKQDPDGNGKDDTIGLGGNYKIAGSHGYYAMDTIFSSFNSYPCQWLKDSSGKLYYGSTAPETRTALEKVNQMYKEGVLDKQFIVRHSAETNELIIKGACGLFFAPWYINNGVGRSTLANFPNMKWKAYNAPLDENGKLKVWVQNPDYRFAVVRKGFEHPEALVKVINVQMEGKDFDPKGQEIYKGLGVSWTMWPITLNINPFDAIDRGYKLMKSAIETKDTSKLSAAQMIGYNNLTAYLQNPAAATPVQWSDYHNVFAGQALAFASDVQFVYPVFYGTTPSMETKWTALKKMEDETFAKIIMGESPIEEFDKFVAEWNKAGGEQIIKEVGEALAR